MKYWYRDNWNGSAWEFKTLTAAKEAAAKECGNVIRIYRNNGTLACVVDASGYTYP